MEIIIIIAAKGYWEPTVSQEPPAKVWYVVIYLILPINLRGNYYFHTHFTPEKMEALIG